MKLSMYYEYIKRQAGYLKLKAFAASVLFFFSVNLNAQQARENTPNEVLHLPPSVEFSAINLCYGDTTTFINQTIRGGAYNLWTVYDSGGNILDTSTQFNYSFYFPAPGTYTVDLVADNGHLANLSKVVVVGSTTMADFAFQACANNFNNMSTCANTFYWDFGDGDTSTAQLATHQYPDTGYYQVTLIAGNGVSFDTLTKTIYVGVVGTPDPSFTMVVSDDTLFFQLNNYIPYSLVDWTFGDATTDTVPQGIHIYSTSGTYYVSVMVRNQCGIYLHDTTIVVSVPVGVQESQGASSRDFSVYPNPATKDVIYLDYKIKPSHVSLIDKLGRDLKIIQQELTIGKSSLNVGVVSSGIYTLLITTPAGVITKKIVIP